jgi:RNA-directed DNA polymerase
MWSPQHYLDQGRVLGVQESVLTNAVEQIERVVDSTYRLPAILSLNHLAKRAGVSYGLLRAIASRSGDPYKHFPIRKRSGGYRQISIPSPQLRRVQQWITRYVLNSVPPHHRSFAFSPGSSILACASRHCGARWLIKMDITGFFSSISEIQVYRVFHSLGYQPLVAFELARITTYAPDSSPRYRKQNWRGWHKIGAIAQYSNRRIGYLPQGAPTSPMLSNLVMKRTDSEIDSLSLSAGLTYSRYSDDMVFSTRGHTFDRSRAKDFIGVVTRVLLRVGFYPNMTKCVIVPPGARKIVLGLLVDKSTPRLSREFRSNLRQHLYYLQKFGPVEHAKARGFESLWSMRRHIRGLIDFANMIDAPYAATLLPLFEAVDWPL